MLVRWGWKHMPEFLLNREGHPAKSIRKTLLICLAIFVPLVAVIIYAIVFADK
ncbi:hypothetical protein GCM10022409_34870 [Hymenobacter glaciei]|uniref:Cardiolipin synthase N-terminal domain-containing protein n=1 Tax=Hymenobacter glaciei TaxID=877209 RepID=A0ABP7UKB8_9BACT